MIGHELPSERVQQLVSQFIDGELSSEEAAELNELVRSDAHHQRLIVDHLLLDSLLTEEVGTESLTALVDLVADSAPVLSEQATVTSLRRATNRDWQANRLAKPLGWLVTAAVVMIAAFLMGRWENSAFANAATIVRAAIEAHAEPVERVYVVRVERPSSTVSEFIPPRDVRVASQGDRFYVEMNRGERRWVWGRDADGAIWLTLGPRRAIVVAQDEVGVPLQYISDLYTLNLETLLENFLKHCRLEYGDAAGATHLITVTPNRRWKGGWMRHATIEVDRETKAVRRLVIEREIPQQGPSTVTFTLVDARTPDESKYRPAGHLTEPFRLLTRETLPDKRRELMTNWFGPHAERWIKTAEIKTNDR